MSFRNLVVARSPKFVTKLARSIRHLELLAASPLLVRKLVKGRQSIKTGIGGRQKKKKRCERLDDLGSYPRLRPLL